MSLFAQIKADSPVGYWPLDEASGATAFDLSGNGNHGTYAGTGGGFRRTLGPLVGGDFPGGSGGSRYVALGDLAGLTPAGASGACTWEAWAIADTIANGAMMLFTKHLEWNVRGNLGTFTWFTVGQGDGDVLQLDGVSAMAVGEVVHWAGTYDRAAPALKLYKNGALVATDTSLGTASAPQTVTDRNNGAYIAVRSDNGGQQWDGAIGHVAYFGTALSAARIAAHYEAGLRSGYVSG